MFLSAHAQDSLSTYKVYLFLGEDCRICHFYSAHLSELYKQYDSDTISFVGLFPNRYSTPKGIEEFRENYKIPFEIKLEYFGTKTKEFGVTITPEVVVYNETLGEISYKGRIDDSYYKVGQRRRVSKHSELAEVLSAIAEGRPITTEAKAAVGCYITFR